MKTLPRALAGLGAFPQFILCQLVEKNGKQIKQPIDIDTLYAGSPIDPKNWMTFDVAMQKIEELKNVGDNSYRLGFTFTAADPLFFYDLDHCIDENDDLNEVAEWSLKAFAGAAVERSQSGTGLHIFGHGECPPHGCKNIQMGIELYTQDRFVMFGDWDYLEGNIDTDCSAALPVLVEAYFPKTGGDWDGDWNDFPQEGWDGPLDDALLIAAAMKAVSQNAAFGSKIKFEDLFNQNSEKLAEFFPPQNDHDEWDMSSADASLAQALAFWTGGNHERIKTIMEYSELKRDKWEDREDYLPRTIGRACGLQDSYYNVNYKGSGDTVSVQPSPKISETVQIPSAEPGVINAGSSIAFEEEQREHFKNFVYVGSERGILDRKGVVRKKDEFNDTYGNKLFSMDSQNTKTTKSAWECFTNSQAILFPKVDSMLFLPNRPAGEISEREGLTYVNSYVPCPINRKQGNPAPFLELMGKMISNERDRNILMGFLAAIVQYPGEKLRYTVVLQGAEGNGKSTLATAVSKAVGERYTALPNAQELAKGGSKFNGWLYAKILVILEEAKGGEKNGDFVRIMKTLLTSERLEFQAKGADQKTGDNVANWFLVVNGKDDIPVEKGNRRYSIVFSDQQCLEDFAACGMTDAYWQRYHQWLKKEGGYAIIAEYLHTMPIADEFNPTLLSRAPISSSMEEAIEASRDPIEMVLAEAALDAVPGFKGDWIATGPANRLLEVARVSHTPHSLARAIKSLGYVKHPRLTNKGRCPDPLLSEAGCRTTLYLKVGHIILNEVSPKGVADAYEKAQGFVVTPNEVANNGTV